MSQLSVCMPQLKSLHVTTKKILDVTMKMEDPMCRTKTQHSQINKQMFFCLFVLRNKKRKRERKIHKGERDTGIFLKVQY